MKKCSGIYSLIVFISMTMLSIAYGDPWWWSVGPVYRADMSIEVSGYSYVQNMGLHGAQTYGSAPGDVGAADAYADRTYDDGFVNIDPGTLVDGLGLTWYWGYDNAVQYDATADTLAFHRGGGEGIARSVLSSTSYDQDEDVSGLGIAAEVGRNIVTKGKVKLGLVGGIQSIWDIESETSQSTYSEQLTAYSYDVVDTYTLEGVVPPAPPYTGNYDGPGPLIGNIPTTRSEAGGGSSTWQAENLVEMDVDVDLQELWLGPRLHLDISSNVAVHCTPYVSVNYVDIDVDRKEKFISKYADGRSEIIQQWHDSESYDEWLFGLGVAVGGRINFAKQWFAEVSASYDSVEEAEVDAGPNKVTIDVSGYSIRGQIGRGF